MFYYLVSIFISVFFLFLTIAVYCLVKNLRQSFFGKLTIGFLCNILLNFILLGIMFILPLSTDDSFYYSNKYKVLKYFQSYSFFSFPCWMTCMSVDIAHTFSSSTISLLPGNPRHSHHKNLLFWIIICQGIPLAVVLALFALNSSFLLSSMNFQKFLLYYMY